MKSENFALPIKAKKDSYSTQHEKILSMEKGEYKPINYTQIINQYYNSLKQKEESQTKRILKQIQAKDSYDLSYLRLPQVQFHNNLLHQVYVQAQDQRFSFDIVAKKIKDELRKVILEDPSIKNPSQREERYNYLMENTTGIIRSIESVISVIKQRKYVEQSSDDYFIGTSDVLDASKKIDLVEYASDSSRSEVRLIQIKSSENNIEDIESIIDEHQKYLNTFISSIQEIIKKDNLTKLRFLAEHKDDTVTNQELEVMKAKWNVIGMGFHETSDQGLALQALCDYIEEKIQGYSEQVSTNDILLFKEIVTNKDLLRDVEALFDEDFLPKGERDSLIAYMNTLEEDFGTILKQYLEKEGVVDLRNVDFYSTITTPNGVVKEKILVNPLKELKLNKVVSS